MNNPNPQNQNAQTQVPPLQSTQTPPPHSPNRNSKKISIKAILGTIILLLLVGGVTASYVYREPLIRLISSPTPTPSPIVTVTPTQIPKVPSDWLTFEDELSGISFKHPKEYEVKARDADNILASIMSPLDPEKTKTFDVNENELKIEVLIPQTTDKTLPQIVNDARNDPGEMLLDPSEYNEKNLMIDGKETIILSTRLSEVVYLLSNDNLIRIIKYPTLTSRQNEFEMILSTFKFADGTSSDNSFTQKCKSDGLGIALMLPKDWTCNEDDYMLGITSDNIQMNISNLGRGGPCAEGPGTSSDCEVTNFHKNQILEVKQYFTPGSSEIFGQIATNNNEEFMWISINSGSINNDHKKELIKILDSLEITN